VRVYLDTNVLVAAFVADHIHHPPALEILKRIHAGKLSGVISTHVIAELYSVLTRTPFIPRIHPADAQRLIQTHATGACETVALTVRHYEEAIAEAAANSWTGGKVFDLLHVKAAMQAKCERLYTFNVQEFRRIAGRFSKAITAP
jgi:predicted nucleic acid-binding protein